MMVTERDPNAPSAPRGNDESVIEKVVRLNPFYLLSVAFVIHGSGFWFRAVGHHEPWKLLALLGGFQVILTLSGGGMTTLIGDIRIKTHCR